MPSISVIVPVYQAERLLPQCVESVLAQSFSDWELLLIDDGCTDSSPALCDRYAAADGRIRALHQPCNAGVSEARNRGLREAAGDYIAFLDADDAFLPQTLETLWALRRETGADTVGCAHWNVTPEGGRTAELLLPSGVYGAEEIREKLVLPLLGQRLRVPIFNGFIWRYLFSAERIRRLGLTFEGAYLEDELFLLEYFCGADRLAVTEQPLYCYLQNPASATRRYMRDLTAVFDRYLERKEALAARYGLEMPQWRENSRWAGLLIAIGNEYAHGNPKSLPERQQTVEALCRQPDMAKAIAALKPEGMSRNKQLVAFLVRRRWFGLLTLLYRVKNHL